MIQTCVPVIYKTGQSEICIDDEGILRIKNLIETEIDLEEVKKCFQIYEELGCRENRPVQLMDLSVPALISKEARDYVDKNGPDYFTAAAIVTTSLPVRIIANFVMKMFSPRVPLKLFNTEEEALVWLRKMKS